MSLSVLLSFTLTSLILALAPGPDNIFVLTNSALYGVRRGLAVIVGLCLGIVVQTACMVAGVTAFVSGLPVMLTIIKLAGVTYLLWLTWGAGCAGLAMRTAARRAAPDGAAEAAAAPDAGPTVGTAGDAASLTMAKLVRRGFIMNITNPKVQLFFLSFFPQFLPAQARGLELMGWMSLLGAIFTAATIVVFSAIAIFAGSLSAAFKSQRFNICLNLAAALIFLSLAIYTLATL